jgi:hypothetical protein
LSSPAHRPPPAQPRSTNRSVAGRGTWPGWLHGPIITLVVVGSMLSISVLLALRTNRALTTIQQADPRRNPTTLVIARPLTGGELAPTLSHC